MSSRFSVVPLIHRERLNFDTSESARIVALNYCANRRMSLPLEASWSDRSLCQWLCAPRGSGSTAAIALTMNIHFPFIRHVVSTPGAKRFPYVAARRRCSAASRRLANNNDELD